MTKISNDRRIAKKLFDKHKMFENDPIAWTAWKMAFHLGMEHERNTAKTNVSGELPPDEEIEKWFAGDRYNDTLFWSEAPFRDNGDVVGLIIDVVKHFTNSTDPDNQCEQ